MGEQCRWERAVPGTQEEAWGPGAGIASGSLRAVLRIKVDCPSQVRSKTLKGESVKAAKNNPRHVLLCGIMRKGCPSPTET